MKMGWKYGKILGLAALAATVVVFVLNGLAGAGDTGKLTMIHGSQPFATLDNDATLAANSDVSVPTQKAIKTLMETGTVTMAGKTLTAPTIASTGWTNANHAHAAANSGGTLNASAIGAGTLVHERGGLEADVSAYSGLVKITGGTTSAVAAPTGAVVGTTDTQELSAKTLASPAVTGDVTVADDATGGNAGAASVISGKVNMSLVGLGTGTNGTTETVSYMDDSPTGEWAPVDADVTESADTTYYRIGTTSYKMEFAASAAAADGAIVDIANDDLETAAGSIGFWARPSVTIASGDLAILIDDTDADTELVIGALTASVWQWVEVDITSLAAGTGNVVDKVGIILTTQGAAALAAFDLYVDGMYRWATADEESLGQNIAMDGVLSVLNTASVDANTGTHAHANLVEHTDYFTHYQTGSDAIVWITDQSTTSSIALICYR